MTDVYATIDQIAGRETSAAAVCMTLGVSRSAYYAWRSDNVSARASRDDELAPLIRSIFWKHRRRYGTRRIASELADRGQRLSRRRVAKLLKNQGLRAIQPKSFVPRTTDSRHGFGNVGAIRRVLVERRQRFGRVIAFIGRDAFDLALAASRFLINLRLIQAVFPAILPSGDRRRRRLPHGASAGRSGVLPES